MTRPPFLGAEDRRAAWAALVTAAARAAERPAVRARGDAFRRAADAVFKLPFPNERVRPFNRLVGFGRAWGAMDAAGREDNAAAVAEAAAECAALLGLSPPDPTPGATPGEPPPGRFRADIDG